jgi:hypothetical protein
MVIIVLRSQSRDTGVSVVTADCPDAADEKPLAAHLTTTDRATPDQHPGTCAFEPPGANPSSVGRALLVHLKCPICCAVAEGGSLRAGNILPSRSQ